MLCKDFAVNWITSARCFNFHANVFYATKIKKNQSVPAFATEKAYKNM